jgi:hypothetical protein
VDNITEKKELTTKDKVVAAIVLASLAVIGYFYLFDTPPVSPEEQEKQQIERWFAYSGEHIKLMNHVKRTLLDPKSFQHVRTVYAHKPGEPSMVVTMEYRANNAFGHVLAKIVSAEIDKKTGDVLRVIAEQ